ncbi:hypothetical protein E2I00_014845, partial [Balaenoptera physalus]
DLPHQKSQRCFLCLVIFSGGLQHLLRDQSPWNNILNGSSKEMDTRSTVEKICQFLGKKLEPEELNSVFRNSITGDWKNYFMVAQAETFDKIFQEKITDLPQ